METKPLIKSKTFWLAAIGFTTSLLGTVQNEVLQLDFSNKVNASIMATIILVRFFSTSLPVSGLFKK